MTAAVCQAPTMMTNKCARAPVFRPHCAHAARRTPPHAAAAATALATAAAAAEARVGAGDDAGLSQGPPCRGSMARRIGVHGIHSGDAAVLRSRRNRKRRCERTSRAQTGHMTAATHSVRPRQHQYRDVLERRFDDLGGRLEARLDRVLQQGRTGGNGTSGAAAAAPAAPQTMSVDAIFNTMTEVKRQVRFPSFCRRLSPIMCVREGLAEAAGYVGSHSGGAENPVPPPKPRIGAFQSSHTNF